MDSQTPMMSSLALKVHARIIGNMSPFCTKEAFINIVDSLIKFFRDKSRYASFSIKKNYDIYY